MYIYIYIIICICIHIYREIDIDLVQMLQSQAGPDRPGGLRHGLRRLGSSPYIK